MSGVNVIRTGEAPEPMGPYTQGLVTDGMIYCSGQLGIDPSTGKLEENLESQTERCIKNLEAVLAEGGSSLNRVLRCTVYLTDLSNMIEFNSVYSRFFRGECLPSRVTIGVSSLPLEALVEIEVIARI
jgi:2-iminobutanoate/2-iminopropanoate deaminase